MTGVLRVPRRAALAAIAVLVAAASVASFAESYRGLYAWAREHGLTGPWAVIWPLQVDVFIAVGELALFVALADAWARRSRIGAWSVTLAGLAVSVAGNVGHVHGHTLGDRATAAVPPLAAAAALAVGLGVLKRVVEHQAPVHGTSEQPAPADVPGPAVPDETPGSGPAAGPGAPREPETVPAAPGPLPAGTEPFRAGLARGEVPSIRRIREVLHVGQPKAQEIQAYLETLTPNGQRIRRIRAEIRQGAPVPEDSPAGASAIPRAPGPPAGVTPNGHQTAERK